MKFYVARDDARLMMTHRICEMRHATWQNVVCDVTHLICRQIAYLSTDSLSVDR